MLLVRGPLTRSVSWANNRSRYSGLPPSAGPSDAAPEFNYPAGAGPCFFDAARDPAGALLSSIGTPLAWDQSALDWSSLDSISETL